MALRLSMEDSADTTVDSSVDSSVESSANVVEESALAKEKIAASKEADER